MIFLAVMVAILAAISAQSPSPIMNYIKGRKCDRCEMSIMSPDWTDITSLLVKETTLPYSIMQYTAGELAEDVPINLLVFVPGSQGSYGQGRSLWSRFEDKEDYLMISLDFKQEISAFSTEILHRQTRFLFLTLRGIDHWLKENSRPPLSSITLIGHSFGGVVVRLLPLIMPANQYAATITRTVLIATPFLKAPLTIHPAMHNLFSKINSYEPPTNLLSISSHHSDILVPFHHSGSGSKGGGQNVQHVRSTSLPLCWSDPHHDAMIWERGIISHVSGYITGSAGCVGGFGDCGGDCGGSGNTAAPALCDTLEDTIDKMTSFEELKKFSFDFNDSNASSNSIKRVKCSSLPPAFVTSLPPTVFRIAKQTVKPVPSETITLMTLINNSKTDITKTLWRWSISDENRAHGVCLFSSNDNDSNDDNNSFWTDYLDEEEEGKLATLRTDKIFGVLRKQSILFTAPPPTALFPRIFSIPKGELVYLRLHSATLSGKVVAEVFPTIKRGDDSIIIWIEDARIDEIEYLTGEHADDDVVFRFKELFLLEYVVAMAKNPEIFILRPIFSTLLLTHLFTTTIVAFPVFVMHLLFQAAIVIGGSLGAASGIDYLKYVLHLIIVFGLTRLLFGGRMKRTILFLGLPLLIPLFSFLVWLRNSFVVGFGLYRWGDLFMASFCDGASDINYGLLYIGAAYYRHCIDDLDRNAKKGNNAKIIAYVILSLNSEPHRWMESLLALVFYS